jgi:hypothetical protein
VVWSRAGVPTGFSVHPPRHHAVMFIARLICSDSDCAEETQGEAGTLDEFERLLCDCGCAFEVIGWPDWIDDIAEVVELRQRRSQALPLDAVA